MVWVIKFFLCIIKVVSYLVNEKEIIVILILFCMYWKLNLLFFYLFDSIVKE